MKMIPVERGFADILTIQKHMSWILKSNQKDEFLEIF